VRTLLTVSGLNPLNTSRKIFGTDFMSVAQSASPAFDHATYATQTQTPALGSAPLNILHVLRAPLGGLFRHVTDLVRGQAARGHRVGLIVDSTTGGARADVVLRELSPCLALGYQRLAIPRELNPRDFTALRHLMKRIKAIGPDVLHGHGAKGAALVRLAPNVGHAVRAYTPHGGSLVYSPGTAAGSFYRMLERLLNARTDLFLFESAYAADLFRSKIGRPRGMVRVVRNGVSAAEFEPITVNPDSTDVVCIGELRPVKAVDVLIEALTLLKASGRPVTATIVGEGPDEAKLKALTHDRGLTDEVRFVGFQPARTAFAMGRMLAIPSRAESLPYVVLEAAAAGLPIVATGVGGVPEIFGENDDHLIPADNVNALVNAIRQSLDEPGQANIVAQKIRARVRSEFSVDTMVDGGLAAYREALSLRKLARFA
jgi:glycosyltransferase involved in cell wall biosynthesis